jgi:hypothetical protein
MLSRTFQHRLSKYQTNHHRKYHAYGLASKFLTILQDELNKKHAFAKIQKETIVTKNMSMSGFMKRTTKSPHLKHLDEIERTMEACVNIRRLCDESFELGKKIRENSVPYNYKISEELDEFIRLTNEHTQCYTKMDYEKYLIIVKGNK